MVIVKGLRYVCNPKRCWLKEQPRWDDFLAALRAGSQSSKAGFTDVDACVELSPNRNNVNGHFLFVEHKGLGAVCDEGQRIFLRKQSAQPNTTVMYLYDTEDADHVAWMIWKGGRCAVRREIVPRLRVCMWLEDWARWAKATKPYKWDYID